jgi:uncharacterized protein YrrD
MMEFRQDAPVRTADGKTAGHIDRVVLDPRTKEVTHIVVRKGLLFTEDRVVPISLIASADEDEVTLRQDAGDLETLPLFEETHYVGLPEEEPPDTEVVPLAPPLYWYPPITGGLSPLYSWPLYPVEAEENIPPGTVALKEGASVVTLDGERVGRVARIITEHEADRVTHLIISSGLVLRQEKIIPVSWLTQIDEDEVHLAVSQDILDQLPEYHE